MFKLSRTQLKLY